MRYLIDYADIHRRRRLLHGKSVRQHQSDICGYSVRPLHYLHVGNLHIHRQYVNTSIRSRKIAAKLAAETGRRPLLIFGAIGMGICHFVIGGV
jgi:hypothetical protein